MTRKFLFIATGLVAVVALCIGIIPRRIVPDSPVFEASARRSDNTANVTAIDPHSSARTIVETEDAQVEEDSLIASTTTERLPCKLTIRVVNSEDEPIALAHGALTAPGNVQESAESIRFLTDQLGRAVADVPPGTWILRIAFDPDGFQNVRLNSGESREIVYRISQGAQVHGTVLDSSGARLAGALISVTSGQSTGLRLPLGNADEQGRFSFRVEPGDSIVLAEAPGYAVGFVSEVLLPGSSTLIDFELARSGSVRGVIKSALGQAIENCSVEIGAIASYQSVLGRMGPDAAFARTDEAGSVTFSSLGPGRHVVVASARDFARSRATVEVVPGAEASFEIILQPSARLIGRTVSADSTPLAGVHLIAFSGDSVAGETRSDDSGLFEIAQLVDSELLVWGFHPSAGWIRLDVSMESERHDAGTLILQPGIDVTGLVHDERDWGISGTNVHVRYSDSEGRSLPWRSIVKTDHDGIFVAPNVNSDIGLGLSAHKSGYAAASESFLVNDVIKLRMPRKLYDVSVQGRVVDERGLPQDRARVTILGSGENVSPGAICGPDGRFLVEGIPRGPLFIILRRVGFARTGIRGFSSSGGVLDVGDLTIELGAKVKLAAESAAPLPVNGIAALVDQSGFTVDKFEIIEGAGVSNPVPQGKYNVVVTAAGYQTEQSPVVVKGSDPPEQTILLTSGELVHVVVRGPADLSIDTRGYFALFDGEREVATFSSRRSAFGPRYSTRFGLGLGGNLLKVRVGEMETTKFLRLEDAVRVDGALQIELEIGEGR